VRFHLPTFFRIDVVYLIPYFAGEILNGCMIYMKVKKEATETVNRESEVESSLLVWRGIVTLRIGVGKFIGSKRPSSLGDGVGCGMNPRLKVG
jgi:hypothetical protein